MTSEQSNQIKSWVIFAVAIIAVIVLSRITVYLGYVGFLILFLAIPLRDKNKEAEYLKEFSNQYSYLVYPSFGLMIIFVGFLIYFSAVHRVEANFIEVLLPLIIVMPVLLFFEYKLFKKNAD